MNDDNTVADVTDLALSMVRAAFLRDDLTSDERKMYFDIVDAVHNVPRWLISDVDAYTELVRHISYADQPARDRLTNLLRRSSAAL